MVAENDDERVPLGDRLVLQQPTVAQLLDISVRTLRRMRSAGQFPAPDFHLGITQFWKRKTVEDWIEEQEKKGGIDEVG